MPDLRRSTCQVCRKPVEQVGPISWRGRCNGCAHKLMSENIEGIALHRGPEFHRWRRAMAACVGGVLLDDTDVNAQTDGHAR